VEVSDLRNHPILSGVNRFGMRPEFGRKSGLAQRSCWRLTIVVPPSDSVDVQIMTDDNMTRIARGYFTE
jgi:hypothetical protein